MCNQISNECILSFQEMFTKGKEVKTIGRILVYKETPLRHHVAPNFMWFIGQIRPLPSLQLLLYRPAFAYLKIILDMKKVGYSGTLKQVSVNSGVLFPVM